MIRDLLAVLLNRPDPETRQVDALLHEDARGVRDALGVEPTSTPADTSPLTRISPTGWLAGATGLAAAVAVTVLLWPSPPPQAPDTDWAALTAEWSAIGNNLYTATDTATQQLTDAARLPRPTLAVDLQLNETTATITTITAVEVEALNTQARILLLPIIGPLTDLHRITQPAPTPQG